MTEKTTVAIDKDLRMIIKKLAAWQDISQGEVIKRAIAEYEKVFLNNTKSLKDKKVDSEKEIIQVLQAATDAIWAQDPETKQIQQKLKKEPGSIDDFILNNWDYGLGQ